MLFLVSVASLAAAVITGTVTDSDSEPLTQATVRLLRASDSTFVAGTAADFDGRFRLNNVKPGKYILETSYVGLQTHTTPVTVAKDQTLTLPVISMEAGALRLAEVNVVGVKTPMKVMTDTVEYNADSYLTRPNAVVEDLLKRLPGVEVDSDGKITANGKEVTKILIDGQEFFSDDPKVASKNLPVQMIEKLQVIDRKSDLARLTGVDDGEDETVINLSVKKEMKNGWFGTAEAGYGTDSRYMGQFNISRFQGQNQFTLLGNINNINELGFTDSNGNRFRRFGGNNGITTSRAIGLNFNVGNGEIFRVGGDVMYSNSDQSTSERSERQYLFTDSTSYYSRKAVTRDRGHNVRADFRILWKPDSFNTLELRPNLSLNYNKSNSIDSAATRAGDALRTLVNQTANLSSSKGNSFEAGMRLIYTHNFKNRRGRSFSVMANWRSSNVTEKENTSTWNRFFLLNDSIDDYDQYQRNHTWSNTLSGRVSWTEPLGNVANGNFLVFSYQASYRWNNADKLVYDVPDPVTFDYLPDLSNRFRNTFFTQNIRVGYKKVTKTTNAEVGVTFVPSSSQSTNLTNSDKSIPRRNVFNIAPFLRYRYKLGKNRSFTANYRGRSSEPSMSQLQPIADMSNPLRIVVGNPDLDPTFTHYIMFRFQDFNAEKQRSFMTMAHFQVQQNAIVSKTTFTPETGGQTTTYENVNGVWNGRLMAVHSQPLRNKKWSLNNHIFFNFNRSVGFNDGRRNATMTTGINFMPGIAFRPDWLELDLHPFYRLETSHSSIPTGVASTTHNFGFRFNGGAYTKWGLNFNTDLNFNAMRGYSQGYDQTLWMWNAQVSYQFLRDKSATIAFKVYDILDQTRNVRRNVTANYIEDIDYNALTRYAMVTFSYRFNTFGKGNQPELRNEQRGPGGHPGPPPPGARRPF